MKCAIYARYSSDMQKTTSIEDQIRNCKSFAKTRGWTVLEEHVYADQAVSGLSIAGRIGLTKLVEKANSSTPPFDYVLVDDTSRLSRDRLEQLQIVDELQCLGVNFYFVSQSIDTADEQVNDVILPVHAIVDALYSKELAKKTQRGMAGQVLAGFSPGGRVFGYDFTKVDDPPGELDRRIGKAGRVGTSISVNPEKAEVVRMIFRLCASGVGQKEIAKLLNRDGFEPPGVTDQRRRYKVKPSWCPSAVKHILQNRKYIGDWTWKRNKWMKNRRTGKRKCIPRPENEWVKYENPALAIVDRACFEAVQRKYESSKREWHSGSRAPRTTYLLSGMLECGICGSSFICIGQRKGPDKVFACSHNAHRGKSVCPNNVTVRRHRLENGVLKAIQEQLLKPDMIERAVERVNAHLETLASQCARETPELGRKAVQLQSEIDNLTGYIARTGEASDSIQKALSGKENELREVESQLDSLPSIMGLRPITVDPEFVRQGFKELKELMYEDVTRVRAELMKIFGKIVLTPARRGKRTYLKAEGESKLFGILELAGNSSSKKSSGGRI